MFAFLGTRPNIIWKIFQNSFEKQFFKKTLVLQRKTTSKQASYQPKGFFSICAFNLLFQAVPRSHDDDNDDGEEDIKTSQSTK